MIIDVPVTDRNGTPLRLGDKIELFDWGADPARSLGVVTLCWDEDEGRITCYPLAVEDAYDFWTKALPRSVKQVPVDVAVFPSARPKARVSPVIRKVLRSEP